MDHYTQRLKCAAKAAYHELEKCHGRLFRIDPTINGNVGIILGAHNDWWRTERNAYHFKIVFYESGAWEMSGNSCPAGPRYCCCKNIVCSSRWLKPGDKVEEFAEIIDEVSAVFVKAFYTGIYTSPKYGDFDLAYEFRLRLGDPRRGEVTLQTDSLGIPIVKRKRLWKARRGSKQKKSNLL